MPGTLFVFGGLPGVGKTTIARQLAGLTGGVHLRIDTIEQALRAARPDLVVTSEGYVVAYALAGDHLALGHIVIADSVNPIALTRDAWLDVARRTGSIAIEVEIICSNLAQHRQQAEGRITDIPGHVQPDWSEIQSRHCEPWTRDHVVIDTSHLSAVQAAARLKSMVGSS